MNEDRESWTERALEPERDGAAFTPWVDFDEPRPEGVGRSLPAILLGSLFAVPLAMACVYAVIVRGGLFDAAIAGALVALLWILLARAPERQLLRAGLLYTLLAAAAAGAIGALPVAKALRTAHGDASVWGAAWLAAGSATLGLLVSAPMRRYFVRAEQGHLRFPTALAVSRLLLFRELPAHVARGRAFLLSVVVGAAVPLVPAGSGAALRTFPLAAGMLCGARVAFQIGAGALVFWLGERAGFVPRDGLGFLFGGALLAAALAAWLRDGRPMLRAWRLGAGGQRIRLEIGGLGTRLEDMVLRTERELSPAFCLFWSAVIAIALVHALPQGSARPLMDRGFDLLVLCGGVLLAVPLAMRAAGMTGSAVLLVHGWMIFVLASMPAGLIAFAGAGGPTAGDAVLMATMVALAAGAAGVGAEAQKAGSLLGATPARQQVVLVVGVALGVLVACFVVDGEGAARHLPLVGLERLSGRTGGHPLAPEIDLFIPGGGAYFTATRAWDLFLWGAGAALVLEAFRVRALAVVLGAALPQPTGLLVLLGGVLEVLARRADRARGPDSRLARGVHDGGAGLLVGEAVFLILRIGCVTLFS